MTRAKTKEPAPPVAPVTLLQLTAARLELDRLIEENGGILTPELEAQFDALGFSRQEKVRAYLARRNDFLATIAVCTAEAKRLQARAKRAEAEVAALEERLLLSMRDLQEKTVDVGTHRVTRSDTTPTTIPLIDPPAIRMDYEELPDWQRACLKVNPPTAESFEWDKVALRQHILALKEELDSCDETTPEEERAHAQQLYDEACAVAQLQFNEKLTIT